VRARPQAEYFSSNGVGQSDTRELIQKPFKKTGTETGRFENDIGKDFHLGQIPVMVKVFGPGGVFSFVKFQRIENTNGLPRKQCQSGST